VRYATAIAFRRALEDRLLERSRRTGLSLIRLRRIVVFERLLARLLVVAPDRWLLKGGLALDLRLGERARTTRDMDLSRHDDEAIATADLRRAQAVPFDDFFTFSVERTDRLDAATEGAAVRYRARAELAGRPFEAVTLDVGFDPLSLAEPVWLPGPDLLSFAGIAPILVPALPLALHVAEKVHAYTRRYGADAAPSSRVKDLVDLVVIAVTAAFEAGELREALERTFAARGQHPLPSALPSPPADWERPYRPLAEEIRLDPDLAAGYALTTRFLNPILGGALPDTARWDQSQGAWQTQPAPPA
jgi:hypothetical protein